ncbi:MBL fold metallo-hydrolase [Salinisphaera sp.]|uniref:MBL fold metallo-hydrolase n=1 Tax=Salinisphaera sp. TaxID=1914330 RepID=UPI0025D4F4AC|nr:MBL fold metallo-hydrolase [Salinisphaera sp.]
MKTFLSMLSAAVLVLAATTGWAAPKGETLVTTAQGDVTLYRIQHASFVLEWHGQTIYVDPTQGAEAYAGLPTADVVLLTHGHGDHLDSNTLNGLDLRKALVIMPQAVADEIGERFGHAQTIMANGETVHTDAGVGIHAMPMYHLPPSDDAYHPKGWGNGYVLTLADKRIYISGDTQGIEEMRDLDNIDVAFVCMNLPYTMDVEEAADAVADFAPAVVYPYHYRGQDTERFRELVNQREPEIEVRLRDWYAPR